VQWRRQTIKLGSAFKGQFYFQVGQMEGRKVPSEARDARSAEGGEVGSGNGRRIVLPTVGSGPEKFSKINFETAHFLSN